MKKRGIKYIELTNEEVKTSLANGWLIIPVGSVEQHSSNLPLSVDTDISKAIAEKICERNGMVLAPEIIYAARSLANSGGGDRFAGNIYMAGSTFLHAVYDILKSYIRNGAHRMLILNGHYENYTYLCEAAELAGKSTSHNIVVMNWWDILTDDYVKEATKGQFENWSTEHAGTMETALEMYIKPNLVKRRELHETTGKYKNIYSSHLDCVKSISGALSSNTRATQEMGKCIFKKIVDEIEAFMKEFEKMEQEEQDGKIR